MKRVTGIGGIFFSANDPVALRAWYKQHLGIDVQEWGGAAFNWTDAAGNPTNGATAWSIDEAGGDHFGSTADLISFRSCRRAFFATRMELIVPEVAAKVRPCCPLGP